MKNFNEEIIKAIDAVIEGKTPSMNASNLCVYRNASGHKCIIGHIIDDEHYHEGLEMKSSESPEVITALEDSLDFFLSFDEIDLLHNLQSYYDSAAAYCNGLEPENLVRYFLEGILEYPERTPQLILDHVRFKLEEECND